MPMLNVRAMEKLKALQASLGTSSDRKTLEAALEIALLWQGQHVTVEEAKSAFELWFNELATHVEPYAKDLNGSDFLEDRPNGHLNVAVPGVHENGRSINIQISLDTNDVCMYIGRENHYFFEHYDLTEEWERTEEQASEASHVVVGKWTDPGICHAVIGKLLNMQRDILDYYRWHHTPPPRLPAREVVETTTLGSLCPAPRRL